MRQVCKYNPICDVREVQSFGYLELSDVMRTGIIPSDLSASQPMYNGIENPESIIGSPVDAFDAMRMRDMISESVQSTESE